MDESIKPAATVVVIREIEDQMQVLMLRRNPALAFAPDTWVFPGGKVEDSELLDAKGDLNIANRLAAVRECAEETGLTLEAAQLIPISHWTTPNLRPKRYATQFFISYLPDPGPVHIDNSEIIEYCWMTPSDALAAHTRGELTIMAPTVVTLTELSKSTNYADVESYFSTQPQKVYEPRVKLDSRTEGTFLYQGDSGYEAGNPERGDKLNRCEMSGGVIKHYYDLD
ncbi:MAG: NUDIX hydrolase [Pseudomonadota bacterium]